MQYGMGQRAFTGGIWVQQWVTEQDKFQKTQKTRKKGKTIIALIIQKVQRVIREMWYSRNQQLHMNEDSRTNRERIEEIANKMDRIYERKRAIPLGLLAPGDRKYFRTSRLMIQRWRIIRKERWVRDAEAILSKYDAENNIEQVRRFRSFFMHRDD